jgi:hypothetical protein
MTRFTLSALACAAALATSGCARHGSAPPAAATPRPKAVAKAALAARFGEPGALWADRTSVRVEYDNVPVGEGGPYALMRRARDIAEAVRTAYSGAYDGDDRLRSVRVIVRAPAEFIPRRPDAMMSVSTFDHSYSVAELGGR